MDLVCNLAGMKYKIRGNVVMVMPKSVVDEVMVQRMYDVLPSFIERTTKISGELPATTTGPDGIRIIDRPAAAGATPDPKDVFGALGVPWPPGSTIRHMPTVGKLLVVNTLENLELFENVLKVINVVPTQVEIEARFVEVMQTDLDSLGFEWLLTDNWELAQHKGDRDKPFADRRIIRVNQNSGTGGEGFTLGNRFTQDRTVQGSGSVNDSLLSISSVLTNPELTFIMHALQRKGNTDLLSAPKVTTQSGQEATIKVVTEYIYPTAYELVAGTPMVVGAVAIPATPTVMPTDFRTREVGVILQVTPDVSPEGEMIKLNMTPQVVSEPTWHDYGYTYTDTSGNPIRIPMEQPFFHLRTVTTSITIYNGATVVMGGMITEKRNDVDDKVPFFGDLPLLGRMFRSKHEETEKRNLLVFVTARLVDPAGRPVKRFENPQLSTVMVGGGGGAAAPAPAPAPAPAAP
jgi:general secretion pathway protein D